MNRQAGTNGVPIAGDLGSLRGAAHGGNAGRLAESTLLKNPSANRRLSYHRPASRYSPSASSSKRTRAVMASAARLQRAAGPHPKVFPKTPRHHAAGAPFNLNGSRSFDRSRIVSSGVVEAREEFGGHVGALLNRQRQGFTKQLGGFGRHAVILALSQEPLALGLGLGQRCDQRGP